MSLMVIGVNHQTASIDWREQVAFSREDIDRALPLLAKHPQIQEAVLISTCNRVELYCFGAFRETVHEWLVEHKRITCTQSFVERCYYYEGIQAVEHLMRVTCGLDSLVLGEPEIFGQVKAGYTQACLHKTVGRQLSRLFQQVFRVAKQVRTSTRIGACPMSVASISSMLAKSWAVEKGIALDKARVLIVGSGDTSRLAALHISKLSPQRMTVVGRNSEKVAALAHEVNATSAAMEVLPELIQHHDIIISATASPQLIIYPSMFVSCHLQLLIDLAVPRDIDSAVAALRGVSLYCIDDLKSMMHEHGQLRVHAAQQAEKLIAQYAQNFMLSLRELEADEVIKQYRALLEEQCQVHLEKALQQLRRGEEAEEVLRLFSRNFTNQIMHVPSENIRRASQEGREDMVNLAYELFS
jgi:glutamyl-tRNA reductase